MVKAASLLFYFFDLLVVAFASTVSIAGNKLHTSGTEALNREKFYSSMCDKWTFSSLIALLKTELKTTLRLYGGYGREATRLDCFKT